MSEPIRESTLRVEMTTGEAEWSTDAVILYAGDTRANRVRFDLYNNGAAVDADDWTAAFTFVRADNVAVICPVAKVDGYWTCTFPSACYAEAGAAKCYLKLSDQPSGAQVTTNVSYQLAWNADTLVPVEAEAVSTPGATGANVTVIVFAIRVRGVHATLAQSVVDDAGYVDTAALAQLCARAEMLTATGLRILGLYGTAAALQSAHPTGAYGDAYMIGDVVYAWTGDAWTAGPSIRGADGTNGKSAYQLAVDGGYSGTVTQWLASLKGATGAAGTNGTNGTFDATTVFATLNTTNKTVLGAINELAADLNGIGTLLTEINGA